MGDVDGVRLDDEVVSEEDVQPSRRVGKMRKGRRGKRRGWPHKGVHIGNLVDQSDEEDGGHDYSTDLEDFIEDDEE
ncbi:hypothetical protein CJ030_MR1G027084 [Morella rubra]|uniref:Uncharacterized protein n=1 Tax=Morella rubra TaxID=262757 RepID=A0A6A1UFU3_9ROSI|nr:hypothetical protein CJ030_MR0G027091 [Morella rubra]KAB1225032.1 hypothetical protein CJ030_MR1G027084 [Morella rubra]